MSRRNARVVGIVGAVDLVLGVLAIVASFVWTSVAVPRLVRYPTDLDVSPRYKGTVTIALDPTTYAPLPEPQQFPLTVERHIAALGDESSHDLVVVHETLTLSAPGLFERSVQEHQYVMDRREAVNVADPRAWAFTPDNPVDRSGSYRLQFPFDADADRYDVYKNETDTTYVATLDAGDAAVAVTGFDGHGDPPAAYAAHEDPLPITPAYRTALAGIVDLPDELTVEQLTPILAAAGVDLQGVLAALAPVADPADLQTLLGLAGQPVALSYVDGFDGADVVDPYTGGILDVTSVVETISAVPDPAVTTTLEAILAKHPDVPEAAAALDVIRSGAVSRIPVFTNEYHQTDESVADVASEIDRLGDRRHLAETTVPRILLIVGIVLAALGALAVALAARSALRRSRQAT